MDTFKGIPFFGVYYCKILATRLLCRTVDVTVFRGVLPFTKILFML